MAACERKFEEEGAEWEVRMREAEREWQGRMAELEQIWSECAYYCTVCTVLHYGTLYCHVGMRVAGAHGRAEVSARHVLYYIVYCTTPYCTTPYYTALYHTPDQG